MDHVMCLMMNRIQWQLRAHACTREELAAYLASCRDLAPADFYSAPESSSPARWRSVWKTSAQPVLLAWRSPHRSGFQENDTARALAFSPDGDWSRPCVVVLHALMSASDIGYRRLAREINRRGWNMVFPHLPFHYSRVPTGFRQGALTITANLTRNAETLRQGVTEIRQLLDALRARGAREFGILGTSYGGWTASIVAALERDLRFAAALQPIADIEHVIWESPVAASIRKILTQRGIERGLSLDHAHLSSPLHAAPPTAQHRLIVAGEFDSVSPPEPLQRLCRHWGDADFTTVRQGHFGYQALETAKAWMWTKM